MDIVLTIVSGAVFDCWVSEYLETWAKEELGEGLSLFVFDFSWLPNALNLEPLGFCEDYIELDK